MPVQSAATSQRSSVGFRPAYFVSPAERERIRKYLANQEEHHRRVTYQEEVLAFLNAHEIEFDPRFVFE